MENVTYLLGAGFSAPAGLPVMSNFISKAKDLYFTNQNEYEYFDSVFRKIDRMSKIKNYLSADLFNIEEVLSILETERQIIRRTPVNKQFVSLLADVVNYYTPATERFEPYLPANWNDWLFGKNKVESRYNAFFASLFGIKYTLNREENPTCLASLSKKSASYSIVTLNYDLLPERFEESISKYYRSNGDIVFNRNDFGSKNNIPSLAKIHGSSETNDIIPPTWSKSTTPNHRKTWKMAREAISAANHLRIIGFSLPVSDSYITYLLKVAILRNEHLKSIDVICLDPTGEVKNRYDKFIHFSNYRFFNANTSEYLEHVKKSPNWFKNKNALIADGIEKAHKAFVEEKR